MDSFGVISCELKALAKKVEIQDLSISNRISKDKIIDFMGVKLKNLTTFGEQSATGMYAITGVLVVEAVKVLKHHTIWKKMMLSCLLIIKKISRLLDFSKKMNSISSFDFEMAYFEIKKH